MAVDLPCKKSDVLWIVWRDAVTRYKHADDDTLIAEQDLAVNCSVGWVRHENEKRLLLGFECSNTGEISHTAIPLDQIVARIPIVAPRKRRQMNPRADKQPDSS